MELAEWPALAGRGIRLRAFAERDMPLVVEAGRDPLIPLITTVPPAAGLPEAAEWIERQHRRYRDGAGFSFCIARAVDDEALGQIGLWPRQPDPGRAAIGYWVGRPYRGAGVITAALDVLTRWAVTLPGLARLELYVEPWNEGSWRAAERVGFVYEGLMRRWEVVGDERRDMFMYSLLTEEVGPRLD
ncbi:GNAT family N-acetyltransferase [Actinomycetospora soli]|uniref:GNAT family N-acetyltransferase n=1 Tax=Actinomycetospora soli TaxID=2893887 RepID=UPI001E329782|nr:GNAT family protein [Actinomycetospora soli]MCD2188609.1 GNAT family N-acetyltransferase [Actinomycetospora soli]